ncbi:hypothetical protein OsJ_34162 [Oryza sativa Japonica Group]|uniref:Uncharacterized protein n=1 Tax=Oryza sativa subsp. japonica TaxID=39947 RepID=B9GB26_ORYSJ|nr:hypothetical protein OsJ_34162 [Oryza sativa Japonica Group]
MAFEWLHPGGTGNNNNNVIAFVCFMDQLINATDDVALAAEVQGGSSSRAVWAATT